MVAVASGHVFSLSEPQFPYHKMEMITVPCGGDMDAQWLAQICRLQDPHVTVKGRPGSLGVDLS